MIYAISIGTNTGDKIKNIEQALLRIHKNLGEVIKVSSVFETEPWGFVSKYWFYNVVFILKSSLIPQQLIQKLLEIEKKMGRVRRVGGYTDRCIDLDIILCDDYAICTESLTLPHPKMHERLFVLLPLQELMPQWEHPVFKKNLSELITKCTDKSKIKKTNCLINFPA